MRQRRVSSPNLCILATIGQGEEAVGGGGLVGPHGERFTETGTVFLFFATISPRLHVREGVRRSDGPKRWDDGRQIQIFFLGSRDRDIEIEITEKEFYNKS